MKTIRTLLALLMIAPASADRPNILFITADDMNRDSVGAFGCTIEGITPNIDKLAAEGTAFDRGFVNIAICMPCRAVWMTGRYPHRSGALGFDRIKPDVPSLPEALKQGGYYNALFGKEIHVVPSRHAAFDLIRTERELRSGRDPQAYAAAMRDAIGAAKEAGKPFFIMANAHDPHRPFSGSKGDYKDVPEASRRITPDEVVVPGFLPDLPDIRTELADYFTSVRRADDVVGAILAELDKAGLTGNTLVIFLSDHGMPLPFAKTNCYLASTATPWIVRWPGHAEPGARDGDHFVSGIDIAPTFLAAAGLENLAGADGSSILPILEGKAQPERNKAFTSINAPYSGKPFPMRAVNDGESLYIWNGWADGKAYFQNESMSGLTYKAMKAAAKSDPAIAARVKLYDNRVPQELYDLRTDPDCLRNLIGESSEKAASLTKALQQQMKATNDPQLENFQSQVGLAPD
ncbi:sulfatase [Akkermansiaceae bacterium]|nr:sulfatase [Akkermansiaceae bacterium]